MSSWYDKMTPNGGADSERVRTLCWPTPGSWFRRRPPAASSWSKDLERITSSEAGRHLVRERRSPGLVTRGPEPVLAARASFPASQSPRPGCTALGDQRQRRRFENLNDLLDPLAAVRQA